MSFAINYNVHEEKQKTIDSLMKQSVIVSAASLPLKSAIAYTLFRPGKTIH